MTHVARRGLGGLSCIAASYFVFLWHGGARRSALLGDSGQRTSEHPHCAAARVNSVLFTRQPNLSRGALLFRAKLRFSSVLHAGKHCLLNQKFFSRHKNSINPDACGYEMYYTRLLPARQNRLKKHVSDVIRDFEVLYGYNAYSDSPCQPFSINGCYVSLLSIKYGWRFPRL